jgi:hypothetical protein
MNGNVPVFIELRAQFAARGSRYSPPREVASLGSGVCGLSCHEACLRRSRFMPNGRSWVVSVSAGPRPRRLQVTHSRHTLNHRVVCFEIATLRLTHSRF